MSRQRCTFSLKFKQQAACLVRDQGYSPIEASRSVGISETVLRRWVRPLQMERQGITPQSRAITLISNAFRNARRALNALSVSRPFYKRLARSCCRQASNLRSH